MRASTHFRGMRPLVAVAIAAATIVAAGGARADLPANFTDQLVVGGMSYPVGFAFVPGGRVLVVEQSTAKILLIRNQTVTALATVPEVSFGGERGLVGIAVDPQWPSKPYVYVHYTTTVATIHVSRFTVTGDLSGSGALAIDPASRYKVIVGIPDNAQNHNGGTVRFGPDGMLYVSLGDDAVGCNAQDLGVINGKILRVDVRSLPAGAGGPPTQSSIAPADNPFVGSSDEDTKLVWAYGVRNPFRFAIDPLDGALFVGDVGEGSWEEVDRIAGGGRNLEWPIREGDSPYSSCSPGATGLAPIYAYDHSLPSGAAVVMGDVYRRNGRTVPFPAAYEGDVFVGDFQTGELRRLHRTGTSWALAAPAAGQPSGNAWGTGYTSVSEYRVGPDGAIWYTRADLGELRRIAYTGTVDVPIAGAPAPPPKRGTYDVQGRRVSDANASSSGIYFDRRKGKSVVLK